MKQRSNSSAYAWGLTGRHMVSAGAGTGKTYNIQILFLRLVLKEIPVTKILVVTFTTFATGELQERLRKVLRNCRCACTLALDLLGRGESADTIVSILKGKVDGIKVNGLDDLLWKHCGDDRDLGQVAPLFGEGVAVSEGRIELTEDAIKHALELVKQAEADFDFAQISTIHGFCSKMLNVNAFESGLRFGMEPRTRTDALKKELMCEFWREFSKDAAPGEFTLRHQFIKVLGMTPDSLLGDLKEALNSSGVELSWGDLLGDGSSVDKNGVMGKVMAYDGDTVWLGSLKNSLSGVCSDEGQAAITNIKDKLQSEVYGFLTSGELKELEKCGNILPYLLWLMTSKIEKLRGENIYHDCLNGNKFRKKGNETSEQKKDNFWKDEAPQVLKDFLGAIERFGTRVKTYGRLVQWLAYEHIQSGLSKRKSLEGFITFDDMLLKLRDALNGVGGAVLAERIRGQFTCALVDEAQDNDPVQSEIFMKIFADGADADSERCFYMIGDPKQAIYKFRGGDVPTFLAAMSATAENNRHTLSTNYRASASYIEEMNTFFADRASEKIPSFFLRDRIENPEISSPSGNQSGLFLDGTELKGKDLLNYGIAGATQEKPEETPESMLIEEIQSLVSSPQVQLRSKDGKDSPVTYSDITVLVKTNYAARSVLAALKGAGIPAVQMCEMSVFCSAEASHLRLLLQAVLEPGDGKCVKKLLGSPWFNMPLGTLDEISERYQGNVQMALKGMNDLWERKNVLVMLETLLNKPMEELLLGKDVEKLEEDQVLAGLLSSWGKSGTMVPTLATVWVQAMGVESLSTVKQLGEVLLAVSLEEQLGMLSLFEYLTKSIRQYSQKKVYGESEGNETSVDDVEPDGRTVQRLGTAEPAVQIVTIHKSKGLEYPIVYVLGMSNTYQSKHKSSVFHDDKEARVLNMNDGNKDAVALSSDEDKQETRRLAYVAITRAKYMCRFLFTKKQAVGLSDAPPKSGKTAEPVEIESCLFIDKTCGRVCCYWVSEAAATPGTVPSVRGVAVPQLETLTAEMKNVPPGWIQTSFSSLVYGVGDKAPEGTVSAAVAQEQEAEKPSSGNDDAAPEVLGEPGDLVTGLKDDNGDAEEDTALSDGTASSWVNGDMIPFDERDVIFQFPGGMRTGTCWHKVFEELDFSAFATEDGRAEQLAHVHELLDHYGQLGRKTPDGEDTEQRQARKAAFDKMLDAVVSREIQVPGGGVLRLKDIKPEMRLPEFGFTYKLRRKIVGDEFAGILKRNGVDIPEDWARGTGSNWCLTGSIDLLCQNPRDEKFYILDWKTNLINANPANFCREGLKAEMKKHFYYLQYILYTVAFAQYYRQQMPGWELDAANYDALFGGCAYVFVRGVDGADKGVFADKPSFELIRELDEYLGVWMAQAK